MECRLAMRMLNQRRLLLSWRVNYRFLESDAGRRSIANTNAKNSRRLNDGALTPLGHLRVAFTVVARYHAEREKKGPRCGALHNWGFHFVSLRTSQLASVTCENINRSNPRRKISEEIVDLS